MSKLQFFIIIFIINILLILYFVEFRQNKEDIFSYRVRKILSNNNVSSLNNINQTTVIKKFEDPAINLWNLPLYYSDKETSKKKLNTTCAQFPGLFDLRFRNTYWQIQGTTNGTLHLYNAYYDNRKLLKNGSLIRVIAMLNRLPPIQMRCAFWFEDKTKPTIVDSMNFNRIFTKGWGGDRADYYQPYLISCPNPVQNQIPSSVSIIENSCDRITNNLQVKYSEQKDKEKFVVCVKGLNFPTESQVLRLVEWIEFIQILGADKIKFYEFNVHPTIKTVLQYYEKKGNIEVTPLTLIGDATNLPVYQQRFLKKRTVERRLQEVIPYNDCLYQHLNDFKYMVALDTDEVIVPNNGSWIDLMEELERTNVKKEDGNYPGAYLARNVYFLDVHQHDHEWFNDIPRYMHMLQHVYRSKNYTKPGYYVKAFFDTEKVITLHNHYPRDCLGGNCHSVNIDTNLAQLQHYRRDTVAELKNNEDYKNNRVFDGRIWRWKNELIERVNKVLTETNILVPKS